MGSMYAWATPEKCLDEMSLSQLVMYHKKGWEAKQTEAKVHWGTYGQLMSDGNPEKQARKKSRLDIEEIRANYPGYENAYYDETGRLVRG